MEFEWDTEKEKTNSEKHAVTFPEAATVFGDPLSMTYPDPDHSVGEYRFIIIGISLSGKALVVGHTDRDDRTRIIYARKATRAERRFYEECK